MPLATCLISGCLCASASAHIRTPYRFRPRLVLPASAENSIVTFWNLASVHTIGPRTDTGMSESVTRSDHIRPELAPSLDPTHVTRYEHQVITIDNQRKQLLVGSSFW